MESLRPISRSFLSRFLPESGSISLLESSLLLRIDRLAMLGLRLSLPTKDRLTVLAVRLRPSGLRGLMGLRGLSGLSGILNLPLGLFGVAGGVMAPLPDGDVRSTGVVGRVRGGLCRVVSGAGELIRDDSTIERNEVSTEATRETSLDLMLGALMLSGFMTLRGYRIRSWSSSRRNCTVLP